ncbi:uncharacterized protein G2W53_005943 [Senna tora]|uniref:Uncharacterized protein n=1 Tax=Senna tora TaxID=362788 RepID=A0A835CBU0_9FABA|nr:uncharacterized protein G2W53_005943 [Senna tora]
MAKPRERNGMRARRDFRCRRHDEED